MSIENAQAFKHEVYKSPQLAQEYTDILSTTDPDAVPERIAQWGRKHGYEFTPAEALNVRERILTASENDELEDEELELVAGGKSAKDIAEDTVDTLEDAVGTALDTTQKIVDWFRSW